MQKLLLLLFTILFFVSSHAQKAIKLSNVLNHVGDSVSVTGWITGVRSLQDAKVPTLFLQMNAEKPNQHLIIMIMNEHKSRLYSSNKNALNKQVRVRGKVRLIDGQPMIVVHNEQQITTLQKELPTPTIYTN